jgi:hypothetical protein
MAVSAFACAGEATVDQVQPPLVEEVEADEVLVPEVPVALMPVEEEAPVELVVTALVVEVAEDPVAVTPIVMPLVLPPVEPVAVDAEAVELVEAVDGTAGHRERSSPGATQMPSSQLCPAAQGRATEQVRQGSVDGDPVQLASIAAMASTGLRSGVRIGAVYGAGA